MRSRSSRALLASLVLLTPAAASAQAAEPPFSGTIFIDGDLVTDADPTTFVSMQAKGRAKRSIYDRRVEEFVVRRVWLFAARFGDGRATIRVNAEFGKGAARTQARRYATTVGRVPALLRSRMRTITINKGNKPYGGGSDDLLIHTGQTPAYVRDGILEETLMHELTHTSIDAQYFDDPTWRAAQRDDPAFISAYARDFPDREDLAESLVPWFGVTFRADRMDPETVATIRETIPNRIAFLDTLGLTPLAR